MTTVLFHPPHRFELELGDEHPTMLDGVTGQV